MSAVGSGEARPGIARGGIGAALFRLRAWLADDEHSMARRMAGTAFLIRVASAAILYLMQVLLARWMGRFEFGIYVYVWTWVVMIGGLAPLGIAYSTQRFIPEYSGAGADKAARLRGFLAGSRAITFALGLAASGIGMTLVLGLWDGISAPYRAPLLLAAACLPAFALAGTQDGIARSYNWFVVAMVPPFIAQPLLILGLVAAAHLAGMQASAVVVMGAAATAVWLAAIAQGGLLQRRLSATVARGPRRYEVRRWFSTALPMLLVDGFYFLLTYTDILVLQLFVDPSDIAVYYAATKTLALIAFIYFAVSAAFAHRFSEFHVTGQRERLQAAIDEAVRWTFWPSLAAALLLLAVGQQVLSLFGPGFADGYPLMFVLAVGLIARASVGPSERLLNMVGEQRVCAAIYAAAFAANLALCLTLVPWLGPIGAAISTAAAIILESALLLVMVKRRTGLHVMFWRR